VEQQVESISSRTKGRYVKNTNTINNKASIGRSRFRQQSSSAPPQQQTPPIEPNTTPDHIYDFIQDPLESNQRTRLSRPPRSVLLSN